MKLNRTLLDRALFALFALVVAFSSTFILSAESVYECDFFAYAEEMAWEDFVILHESSIDPAITQEVIQHLHEYQESGIAPRLACPSCRIGTPRFMGTIYSEWIRTGNTREHLILPGLSVWQFEYRRTATTQYSCSHCSWFISNMLVQTQWRV